ncbi:MAG: hypothetical protein ACRD22_05705, partial [Terriglobia bacterium]
FGITRASGQAKGENVSGVGDEGTIHLRGKQLHLIAGDEGVGVSTGKALAQSGNVPLIIENDFGKGKAMFLNVEISRYPYERLQANAATSLPEVMEGVFGLAGIEPRVKVVDAKGQRLAGTEIVRFANGDCEHIAIFRNPQFDDGGWGDLPTLKAPGWAGKIDNSFLETPANVTVSWASPMQTYDIRGRKDLGVVENCQAVLSPWEPLVFTLASNAIPQLQLDAPASVGAGHPLRIVLHSASTLPGGAFRVVRLEFITPAGQSYSLYARNLLIKSTPHSEIIPLAHNELAGRWLVRAHDLMTGDVVEKPYTVQG